jgi:hypothetical protein
VEENLLELRIPYRRLVARPALFALAATTTDTAALSLVLTAALASAAVNYVALGNSYASGLGAGNYSGDSCDRRASAYPQLGPTRTTRPRCHWWPAPVPPRPM